MNGAVYIRTPVASKKAFATAAGDVIATGSPTPPAKLSFALHWTTIGVTFGASLKRMIG